MSKMTIIEGNSNDKDNVRAYMVKGEPGTDGVSPTITPSRSGEQTTLTIVDAEGTKQAVINDGVSPIVEVSKEDGITDITITDINGTKTTEIVDGIDLTGGVPTAGVIGFDGTAQDIPDGYEVTGNIFPQIVNSHSTSTTDAYSSNYMNDKIFTDFETGTWTLNTTYVGYTGYMNCYKNNRLCYFNANFRIDTAPTEKNEILISNLPHPRARMTTIAMVENTPVRLFIDTDGTLRTDSRNYITGWINFCCMYVL